MPGVVDIDQPMSENIAEELRQKKHDRRVWIAYSLAFGLLMFVWLNALDFFFHPHQRLTDTKEFFKLPISFLVWVGGSYLSGEWRWRRIERRKKELSVSEWS
jgi:hypothetical protein